MTMEDGLITPQKWRDCWRWYRAEQQQQEGINLLYEHIKAADPALLHESAEWLQVFRSRTLAEGEYANSWEGVKAAAAAYGARFPQVVAAQWALESNYGAHPSGRWNMFGLKGPGTPCKTSEVYGGKEVRIVDTFMDFTSLGHAVRYLCDRWYKDFKGYRGVNRATTPEECARLLQAEGYATDPLYSKKLITIFTRRR
jgi:hypothetical protein